MKKTFLLINAVFAVIVASAQAKIDQVLMTIDKEPIMASEFMYIYEKNNQETTMDQKTIDEYMNLFINFKLKVKEAQDMGLDTTTSFKKELAGYRAQATPKYMKDQEAIDSLIQMSYYRMAHNRRAAHIVLRCDKEASDSASDAVLARILQIRERVTTGGEDFLVVAKQVSEDPGLEETGGELGWVTPFRFVYIFENAVYNTPVGQVSEPFRSPFGWHIALVEEERDHEEVHAAHIMKMAPKDNEQKSHEAQLTIDSIYNLLLNGADFGQTAQALSDDKGSAIRGGDLGWFGRGAMVKPFEDAVFALQDNEVSTPFKSRFGWHIAITYARRGIQPLDSIRQQIAKQVSRDERNKEADRAFIRKARAEYQLPDTMSDQGVRAYVDEHLEEKYPEFRNLVQEYHDGILLFDISLENVWDKASKDTIGLTRYFKKHRKQFAWIEPRWKGYIIYAKDQADANQAKSIIRSAKPEEINNLINKYINTDSIKNVKIEQGIWVKGKSKVVDKLGFKLQEVTYTPSEDMPVVIAIGKVIKAPQEYSDERAKVVSAYQDELEKLWIEELKKKHTISVNHEVLNSLKKK